MSKFEKAKLRLLSKPADYTFSELRFLLGKMGFSEFQKGKTSGSRVKFYREEDGRIIMVHKPHPEDTLDKGAVQGIIDYLKEIGEL